MLINLIGFQICWFGLIYFGNYFIPLALVMLAIHLRCISTHAHEFILIILVAITGSIIDFLLMKIGVFRFDSSLFIPFWLISLWACFAATIGHSLQYLKRSMPLQLLTGFLLAPLSYLAGAKLDAVDFPYSMTTTYFILAPVWAILMVIFFRLDTLLLRGEANNAN